MAPAFIVKIGKKMRLGKRNYTSVPLDYLDETSVTKDKYRSERQSQWHEGKLNHAFQYLEKEEIGRIYVGGYFHSHLLNETKQSPLSLPNEQKKPLLRSLILNKAVQSGTKLNGVIAHRAVVSMSDEFRSKLETNGYSCDKVMNVVLKRAMASLSKQFYSGERLGYAYGFHHDTDHLHMHVLLSARDESGNYVSLSKGLKGRRRKDGYVQRDSITLLKDFFEKYERTFEEAIAKRVPVKGFEQCHTIDHMINQPPERIKAPATKYDLKFRDLVKQYLALVKMQKQLLGPNPYADGVQTWRKRAKEFIKLKQEYLEELDYYYRGKYIEQADAITRMRYFSALKTIREKGRQNVPDEVKYVDKIRFKAREFAGITKNYKQARRHNYVFNILPQKRNRSTQQTVNTPRIHPTVTGGRGSRSI